MRAGSAGLVRARAATRRVVDVAGPAVLGAGVAAVAVLVALVAQLPALANRYDAALASGPADTAALHGEALARERWQLLLAGLLVVIVGAGAVLLARRFLGPVRTVTGAAEHLASETLPALDADGDPEARGVAVPERAPRDVTALAEALASVQVGVSALARRQHDRLRQRSELAARLDRRSHALLDRVVTQVDAVRASGAPPTVLAEIERLGQSVARARRHAESMLVLTGAVPDRVRSRTAAVADVVRTALAGVEDRDRVDAHAVEPAAVAGAVVPDLTHLVAELVDNATQFSPPQTRVRVSGAPAAGGYRLRVVDRGVGMTPAQLDEANLRIRRATSGTPETPLVGLDVVGRLAARHGITVDLARGDAEGLVAVVTVRAGLLAPMSELPAPRRPVSALVAAAAFRPPRAGSDPVATERPAERARGESAAAEVTFVRPGVPRRVRGAQLPDLGPDRDEGPRVVPDAGRVRGRLHALQAGQDAARTHSIPPLPHPLPDPAPSGDE